MGPGASRRQKLPPSSSSDVPRRPRTTSRHPQSTRNMLDMFLHHPDSILVHHRALVASNLLGTDPEPRISLWVRCAPNKDLLRKSQISVSYRSRVHSRPVARPPNVFYFHYTTNSSLCEAYGTCAQPVSTSNPMKTSESDGKIDTAREAANWEIPGF